MICTTFVLTANARLCFHRPLNGDSFRADWPEVLRPLIEIYDAPKSPTIAHKLKTSTNILLRKYLLIVIS